MKSKIISSLFTLLILACAPAMSEIYTWVDESGKKYFGDKIPERYQDQGSEYAVSKTNSSQSITVKRKKIGNQLNKPIVLDGSSDYTISDSPPKPAQKSCSKLKQEYQLSKMCYASCRSANAGKIGPGCQRCTNAKKPKC